MDNVYAKQKLFEIYKNEWRVKSNATPKLRTYISYKNDFGIEPYVRLIHNRGQRSIVAQFRSGVLPLAIETGRYNNIPVEYRLCKYCNCNLLEDEKHFLFYCPVYSVMRKTLGDKATEIDPNYTAIFLYNAYDKRKLLTYV